MELTMKHAIMIAGIFAVAVAFAPLQASARNGGGNGASHGNDMRGLDRADQAAGVHGVKGRAVARNHGANAYAFCPPGQRKKAGLGSRFQC